MDVAGRFLAIFCFRWTYYEVCTTENRQKYVRLRRRDCGGVPVLWSTGATVRLVVELKSCSAAAVQQRAGPQLCVR